MSQPYMIIEDRNKCEEKREGVKELLRDGKEGRGEGERGKREHISTLVIKVKVRKLLDKLLRINLP